MRLDFIACKYTHFIQNIFYGKVIFLIGGLNIRPKKPQFHRIRMYLIRLTKIPRHWIDR